MEQKAYGKQLFFSRLQMIPVREEPAAEQKPELRETQNREQASRRRKAK